MVSKGNNVVEAILIASWKDYLKAATAPWELGFGVLLLYLWVVSFFTALSQQSLVPRNPLIIS